VLDFAAVRVGFVTQLLWDRYGPFWLRLVRDAGAEGLLPMPDAVRTVLAEPRVAAVAPLTFRLAAAQAVALAAAGADALLVPDLNGAEKATSEQLARGGGLDPWIADFPTALRDALAGLPALVPVPVELGDEIDRSAVTALQNLLHDAHAVRRIWGRRRAEARPPRRATPAWSAPAGARRTVGLVGQPWLLNDALAGRATAATEHVVSQHRLDPELLRAEARRLGEPLLPTDAETLGAARLFGRRGGVSEIRMVADRASAADAWLANRVRGLVRKPFQVRFLDDVLAGADAVDIVLVAPVD
jgi:hypothetical protein